MLLDINSSSSTIEWQILPQAQDQCIIWFNLCLKQIETNQVATVWSIRTFNGDKLRLVCGVICHRVNHFYLRDETRSFLQWFSPKSHDSNIKCHSRPVVKPSPRALFSAVGARHARVCRPTGTDAKEGKGFDVHMQTHTHTSTHCFGQHSQPFNH